MDAIRKGDEVLVRGRVQTLYAAEGLAEITFEEWWPRWSATLVKVTRIVPLPPAPIGTPRQD
jgi:hypothetical protein